MTVFDVLDIIQSLAACGFMICVIILAYMWLKEGKK